MASNIIGFFTGRDDFRPQDREFLKEHGNARIKNIVIFRKPVLAFIKPILNVISMGTFQKLLNSKGYDKLFHLYLRIDYMSKVNGIMSVRSLKLEKNEVITMSTFTLADETGVGVERCNILLPPDIMNQHNTDDNTYGLTIRRLLDNTKQLMGDKFFTYSALNGNNCQNFVMSILQANRLLSVNPQAKPFVFQDISAMKHTLSSHVSDRVTGLAAKLDVLLHGKGFEKSQCLK